MRDQLLTTRNRRPLLERAEAAREIALRLTAEPAVRRAATVAAYIAVGSEPGTAPLGDALVGAGKRIVPAGVVARPGGRGQADRAAGGAAGPGPGLGGVRRGPGPRAGAVRPARAGGDAAG